MNIVILGNGQLGSAIEKLTNWNCLSREKNGFNICNEKTYKMLDQYDSILNCIGFTDTYSNDMNANWNVNYKGVSKLVDYCESKCKKIIHISTDYLYTYSKSGASENDVPVHCRNWYGYTKLLGDGYIQLKSSNYLIIRCSFKPCPFPYSKAVVNQIGNFDYTDKIAQYIVVLIRKESIGVFNVGSDVKTIYQLAKASRNVEPMFEKIHETMPTDITMDCSKMMESLK